MKWTLPYIALWVLCGCRGKKNSVHSANSESFYASPYAAFNNGQIKGKGHLLVGCIRQTHTPTATMA